jgi:hypothetical protein
MFKAMRISMFMAMCMFMFMSTSMDMAGCWSGCEADALPCNDAAASLHEQDGCGCLALYHKLEVACRTQEAHRAVARSAA